MFSTCALNFRLFEFKKIVGIMKKSKIEGSCVNFICLSLSENFKLNLTFNNSRPEAFHPYTIGKKGSTFIGDFRKWKNPAKLGTIKITTNSPSPVFGVSLITPYSSFDWKTKYMLQFAYQKMSLETLAKMNSLLLHLKRVQNRAKPSCGYANFTIFWLIVHSKIYKKFKIVEFKKNIFIKSLRS
jgi:hypothetical protein